MVFSDDPEIDFTQNYLRKELINKVKEDSLIFEFIQEGVLDGVFYWDLVEPENEWMSPKFWKTFGYDPMTKKHLASEWQDMIFEEDLKLAMKNFTRHMENPNHPYDQIVRYRHKDGSTVWVRCRGLAIHDNDGKPIRMVGAHTDITPMMRKQQELAHKQLNVNELTSRIIAAESALSVEKMLTASQKQALMQPNHICEVTGMWRSNHAMLKAESLFEIASRTQLPFNIVMLQLSNHYAITANFGEHEVENKLALTSKVLKKDYPNFIFTHFDKDIVFGFQIGYSQDETAELIADIDNKLLAYSWSIVTPIWHCEYSSTTPKPLALDEKLSDCFNAFFKQSYTELSQKLL